MIKLSDRQRRMFAEKFMDFSHIASGALVFGQMVSGQKISVFLIAFGVIILIVAYWISYKLTKNK